MMVLSNSEGLVLLNSTSRPSILVEATVLNSGQVWEYRHHKGL